MKSLHAFRISAIAAAFALAVPAIHAEGASTLPTKAVGTTQANQSYDSFIITYRDGSAERSNSSAVLQNVQAAISRAGMDRAIVSSEGVKLAPLTASYKRKLAVGPHVIKTSRRLSQSDANNLMLQIASDPAVLHVQPNRRMYPIMDIAAPANVKAKTDAALQTFTPDDPYYAKYQWHFSNPIGGANINNAWDFANGTDITVAVIDTGITQHPDLDTSLADAGYDFISDAEISGRDTDDRASGGWDTGDWTEAGQCYPGSAAQPSSWHGTHTAGTIAELTDNGEGMAGSAYNAKVLPVRALGHCGGYESDIADAITWAAGGQVEGVPNNEHPAQVINMSLGGESPCDPGSPEALAIADAISRGATVVVSAGNSNADAAGFSPASCPGVITVAANGITGKRAFYSNYGSTVTLSAPGGGYYTDDDPNTGTVADPEGFVWSTVNTGETTPNAVGQGELAYGGYTGTSMSAPHVSGAVALVLSATKAAGLPDPTPAEIKTILTKSVRPFPVAQDRVIGAGIVDAAAAINLAVNGDDGNPGGPGDNDPGTVLTKGVILSSQSIGAGASVRYSITVPAGATTLNIRTIGGSGGDVSLYVKAGTAPAADGNDADFKSAKPGNNEAVVLQKPEATTYYILVVGGESITNNLSVLADYKL